MMKKKVILSNKEMHDLFLVMEDATRKAASILLKYQNKLSSLKLNIKESQGLSSTADLESETMVIKTIGKAYPDHEFLAEEGSYGKGREMLKHFEHVPFAWVIDPLDGTNNYLNGLPFYAVSIALIHYGKPLMGMVYNPPSDTAYWAIKGRGAYMSPLRFEGKKKKLFIPKSKAFVKDCIFCSGFAISEREGFDAHEFNNFKKVYREARAVRRFGAAALELCYVAQGSLDGFWEMGLYPWDVAAAGLICEEAGVKVTDFKGHAFTPFDKSIFAARSPVYSQVIKLIEQ